jgi:hypothetical protein
MTMISLRLESDRLYLLYKMHLDYDGGCDICQLAQTWNELCEEAKQLKDELEYLRTMIAIATLGGV